MPFYLESVARPARGFYTKNKHSSTWPLLTRDGRWGLGLSRRNVSLGGRGSGGPGPLLRTAGLPPPGPLQTRRWRRGGPISRRSLGAKRCGVVTRLGPCWPNASSACGRGRAATPGSLRQPSEGAGAPSPSLGHSAVWGPEAALCPTPLPRGSEPGLGCGQTCLSARMGLLAQGPVLPEGGWGGTLCSGPGPGSSSPSPRPSGSPAAGTTDRRHPCSGWRSPPWAGGSHCGRQEGETVHRAAAGEAPESSVHPRRRQTGRGVWFLCPAPDTGHAANTASPGLHVGRGPRDSAVDPAIPSGPAGRRRAICPTQRPEERRAKEFIHPGVESQGPCPDQSAGGPLAHITGAQNP